MKVPITLLKIAPEADAEDTGKFGGSLVDMLLEGIAADVECNIDTCLVLSKEGLDIRLELEGVGSSEVDNGANMGRDARYNAASGRLDDLHFIKGLIRGISDVTPLVHPGGVGNLLGEVLLTLEGLRKLGIEGVVQLGATDVDDLAVGRSPGLGGSGRHLGVGERRCCEGDVCVGVECRR